MELQVIKCIVVTSTVSWHRGQSFYSSLPLIAWVMLLLTFLCEGVLGAQWAFCLTPSDAFSGQTGASLVEQEFCHLSACRWATTSSMSSSLPINPQKAATAASQSLCFLTVELVVKETGILRYHMRGATCTVSPAGTWIQDMDHSAPCMWSRHQKHIQASYNRISPRIVWNLSLTRTDPTSLWLAWVIWCHM